MKTTLILLTLVALAFAPEPADARMDEGAGVAQEPGLFGALDTRQPDARTVQSNCASLSQAIASVRRRTNGKIIDAKTRVQGGREVHYIKVLKDGKVRTHAVNGCRR